MSVRKKIVDVSKATYSAVESRLSGVFKLVPPRREFVRGLGHQIQVHPPASPHRLTDLHFILIVIAGLLSLLTLVAVGVRALISLFSGRRRDPNQA